MARFLRWISAVVLQFFADGRPSWRSAGFLGVSERQSRPQRLTGLTNVAAKPGLQRPHNACQAVLIGHSWSGMWSALRLLFRPRILTHKRRFSLWSQPTSQRLAMPQCEALSSASVLATRPSGAEVRIESHRTR
jgi:hypothetical protein